MKIANVVALMTMALPMASALRGVQQSGATSVRILKGDDGGDEDEDGDGILDGILPDTSEIADLLCFSETSTVQVLGKGSTMMKDLQVGEQILTASGSYQEMYAWGHKKVDELAQFVQLETAETTLEMTGRHLVFLQNQASPVRADSVKLGDVLQGSSAVTKIGTVERQGAYAPFTQEGSVVVDGVAASSYIAFGQDKENMTPFMSHHDYVHMGLSPFRLVCMGISSSLCTSLNEDGMSYYPAFAAKVNEWVMTQNAFVQALVLFAVLVLTGASMMLENTFGATWAPAVVFAAGATVAAMKASGVSVRANKVKTV